MKKALSVLLVFVMVLTMLPVTTLAAELTGGKITFTTTFNNEMGVGDTFTVTATLSENPGIASFTNQLKWNDQVVQFLGFQEEYDEDEEGYFTVTEVFTAQGWALKTEVNGTFTAARTDNKKKNGILYIGEFKILAEEGALDLGLTTTEHGEKFTFANDEGKDIDPELNFSAISNLTVGGKVVGAPVPDKLVTAGVAAMTTDKGAVLGYECLDDYLYEDFAIDGGNGPSPNAPVYLVKIPAGAQEVYVQYSVPLECNLVGKEQWPSTTYGLVEDEVYEGERTLYSIGDATEKTNGMSCVRYKDSTKNEVTIPLIMDKRDMMGNIAGQFAVLKTNDDSYLDYGCKLDEYGLYQYYVVGNQILTGDKPIIAYFVFEYGAASEGEDAEPTYTITVEQTTGGTVTVCDAKMNEITEAVAGASVYLQNTPADGYRLVHYLIDGATVTEAELGMVNGCYTMPEKDVVISAVFELIPPTTYDVTVNTAQYGTVSADKTKAAAGDTVTLTVEPAEGYVLETLTVMYGETAVEVTNNAFAMPAGNVTVSATFKPEEPEVEPNPITEIEVSHPNIEVDETTGDMFMAMVSGASEQIDMSFTVADAELESSQIVFWSSSDDTVATVDQDGKITALKAGTVTITAKAVDASGIALLAEEEDVLAQITLTVADPAAGYTVNMGADVEVVANETIQIPVTVTHSDSNVTDYKSFEFTFQYDPTVLTLKNESSAAEGKDITIVNENGTITVRRYGNALNVGDAAITLEFTAKKTGNTNVKLTGAKVGTSDDAQNQNIPTAQIVDNLTKISVPGYTVKLPGEFEGERVIIPGEDYTFTAKDLNYNYTITATIGNQTLTVTGSGTEADPYKIAADQITGNIEITTEKSGKQFEITLNGESLAHESGYTVVDGKTYAQYMETYTAKLTKKDHYIYELKVTVNGADVEYDYNSETGLITIAGNLITGPVVIESGEQESEKHDVEFEGTYSSHAKYEGDSAVYDGEDFSFTIETPEGFVIESYEVSYKMGDAEEYTTLEATEGIYTVEDITAAVTIKIEGTSDRIVEVNEFVKLNGKTVFLVTATQTLPEGKNLAYNGNVMYLKNFAEEGADTMKQKYSYLVIIESGTLTVEEAAEMITVVEAESTILADTFNVNKSTALDINDAQLVYDLYNNVYQEIETVGMEKFLLADVNGSRNINVSDAAAVVGAIINPTA